MGDFSPMACPSGIIKLLRSDPRVAPLELYANVVKINDHYRAQKRIIVVTQKCLYNIKYGFFRFYSIQRTVEIEAITGLVRNPQTNDFVLKMSSAFPNDYHYQGDCWEALTAVLLRFRPNISVWTLYSNIDIFVRRKSDASRSRSDGILRLEQDFTGKAEDSRHSTNGFSIIRSGLH